MNGSLQKSALFFTVLLVFLTVHSIAHSQQQQWKKAPLPDKCQVNAIVYSTSGSILAGTDKGVFITGISSAIGESWTDISSNLPNKNISAITGLLYQNLIAATDSGIFITSNLGATWQPAQDRFFATKVHAFDVDYELAPYVATNDGVWTSTDKGNTWKQIGMKGIDVLSIDYWVNCEILAGASRNGDDGVYYTKDYGEHWQRILNETLNTNAVAYGMKGFYAGTYSHNPFDQNVRVSTDNGATWTESGLVNCSVSCFAFYQNPIMFAGIKQAGVFGDTTTFQGVQLSSDAGKTWASFNEGLSDTDVNTLLVINDVILAGTASGIFIRNITGITDVQEETKSANAVSISLNPSTNLCSITTNEPLEAGEYSVFDIQGNKILNNKVSYKPESFSTEYWANGVYCVRVVSGVNTYSKMICVVH